MKRAAEAFEGDVSALPAVSIITTTFNRTDYLRQAIQSALSQSFTDFELLICDDGGLEETRRLCESFHDPRILHTTNPRRLGIAMNTYSGIQRARSDVIAFLNDDDRWTSDFLARCATPLLDDGGVVLAFSDHWLIDSQGNRLPEATEANTSTYGRKGLAAGMIADPVRLMVQLSVPLAMAAVFRKSGVHWDGYSHQVEGAYDSYIAYSLIRGGRKIIYLPERLTEYRTHTGGASAEFHRHTTEGLAHVHRLMLHDPAYRSIQSEVCHKYLNLERHLVKLSFSDFNMVRTVSHIAQIVRYKVS